MVEYKTITSLKKELEREYRQVQKEHLKSLKELQVQLDVTAKLLKRTIKLTEEVQD